MVRPSSKNRRSRVSPAELWIVTKHSLDRSICRAVKPHMSPSGISRLRRQGDLLGRRPSGAPLQFSESFATARSPFILKGNSMDAYLLGHAFPQAHDNLVAAEGDRPDHPVF